MEAPEKIYIDTNDNLSDSILYAFTEKDKDDDIEYTRTDAVIEKAVEYIANNMRCDGYTLQTKAKFIKEFRNYLKEAKYEEKEH